MTNNTDGAALLPVTQADIDAQKEIAQIMVRWGPLWPSKVQELLARHRLATQEDAERSGVGDDDVSQADRDHAMKWINHNMMLATGMMKSSSEAGNGSDNFRAHDAYRALKVAKSTLSTLAMSDRARDHDERACLAPPFYASLVEKAMQDYIDGTSAKTLAETAQGIVSSIRNPCDKIFDHKWLDPECVETGCQSLVWKSRYEAAVKGRQEFRQALREERAATPQRQEYDGAALGRFGHHPEPAIDFEYEVEQIESIVADLEKGMRQGEPVPLDRIERAMTFRVGGDAGAVAAKATLRKLETRALALTPTPDRIGKDAVREALVSARHYVVEAVDAVGGIDACEIHMRHDLEAIDRALAATPAQPVDETERLRAHISEQIEHVEQRIKDGVEMGAAIWRIALEDVARENRAALRPQEGEVSRG